MDPPPPKSCITSVQILPTLNMACVMMTDDGKQGSGITAPPRGYLDLWPWSENHLAFQEWLSS